MKTFEIEVTGTMKFTTVIPYEANTLEETIELAKKEQEIEGHTIKTATELL